MYKSTMPSRKVKATPTIIPCGLTSLIRLSQTSKPTLNTTPNISELFNRQVKPANCKKPFVTEPPDNFTSSQKTSKRNSVKKYFVRLVSCLYSLHIARASVTNCTASRSVFATVPIFTAELTMLIGLFLCSADTVNILSHDIPLLSSPFDCKILSNNVEYCRWFTY